MNGIKELLLDPTIYGHWLVDPTLWYGRKVLCLYEAPLNPDKYALPQRVKKLFHATLFAFLGLSLTPAALLGLGIKAYNRKKVTPSLSVAVDQIQQSFVFFRLFGVHKIDELLGRIDEISISEVPENKNASNGMPLDLIRTNLLLLKRALQTLDQGQIRVSPDGNCWLHSSILGLKKIFRNRQIDPVFLRARVVEFMREQYPDNERLRRLLESSIEADFSARMALRSSEVQGLEAILQLPNISEEEKQQSEDQLELLNSPVRALELGEYFEKMGKDRTFGGSAELYAISQLFQVSIEVFREVRGPNKMIELRRDLDEQFPVDNPCGSFKVVMVEKGNHFNYIP